MLGCGTSDGSVTILTVRQTFAAEPGVTHFTLNHKFHLSIEPCGGKACEPDGKAITAMRWMNVAKRSVGFFFSQHCASRILMQAEL